MRRAPRPRARWWSRAASDLVLAVALPERAEEDLAELDQRLDSAADRPHRRHHPRQRLDAEAEDPGSCDGAALVRALVEHGLERGRVLPDVEAGVVVDVLGPVEEVLLAVVLEGEPVLHQALVRARRSSAGRRRGWRSCP